MAENGHRPILPLAVAALFFVEAATFLFAAVLHLGVPIGFLAEPRIVPATVVETICGIGLAIAASGIVAHRAWGRRAAITAHLIAIGGVLLGMAALAAGRVPRTETNDLYHRVILALLVAGLLFLLSRPGREGLARPS